MPGTPILSPASMSAVIVKCAVVYVKTGRLVYTVRDGKIVSYELENLDESEVARNP